MEYSQLSSSSYACLTIDSLDICTPCVRERSRTLVYDANSQTIINLPKFRNISKIHGEWKYPEKIKASIYNNKNSETVIGEQIIIFNDKYFIQMPYGSMIYDIPEFNISVDTVLEDFPILKENPYIDNKAYYVFTNINSFQNFIKNKGDHIFYNCSEKKYLNFLQRLKESIFDNNGLFFLRVHINRFETLRKYY